jgi:hypothetical protein
MQLVANTGSGLRRGHRHYGTQQSASTLWNHVLSLETQMYRCPANLLRNKQLFSIININEKLRYDYGQR